MAMTEPLARVTEVMREHEEPGWEELGSRVLERVRAVVRPAALLLVRGADGLLDRDGSGSRTRVSDRVVRAAVRQAVDGADRVVSYLDLEITDELLVRVEVGLTCRYGVDVRAAADAARDVLAQVLTSWLGPEAPGEGPVPVDVTVDDVVDGDPRVV